MTRQTTGTGPGDTVPPGPACPPTTEPAGPKRPAGPTPDDGPADRRRLAGRAPRAKPGATPYTAANAAARSRRSRWRDARRQAQPAAIDRRGWRPRLPANGAIGRPTTADAQHPARPRVAADDGRQPVVARGQGAGLPVPPVAPRVEAGDFVISPPGFFLPHGFYVVSGSPSPPGVSSPPVSAWLVSDRVDAGHLLAWIPSVPQTSCAV